MSTQQTGGNKKRPNNTPARHKYKILGMAAKNKERRIAKQAKKEAKQKARAEARKEKRDKKKQKIVEEVTKEAVEEKGLETTELT
jgi:hypothetical protein